MSTRIGLVALIAAFFFITLPLGCGGCDETGGTTPMPDGGGLTDAGDTSEFDADEDVDPNEADVTPDTGPPPGEPCDDEGVRRPCGSDVGECLQGSQYCVDGAWTECIGGITPQAESCNGRDDNCSGTPDDEPDLCPFSVCYGAGQCLEGTCVYDPSTALDCSALDTPCMIGLCVEKENGECIQIPREDGSLCNDGNLCTVDEGICSAGECIADTKDCSQAADQCNEGVCDSETGACVAQPAFEGTSCDDALF